MLPGYMSALHILCLSFPSGELPPVTLEGGHDMLRVIFHLPSFLYRTLPEDVMSGNGIKIHTVLFNKGRDGEEEEGEGGGRGGGGGSEGGEGDGVRVGGEGGEWVGGGFVFIFEGV